MRRFLFIFLVMTFTAFPLAGMAGVPLKNKLPVRTISTNSTEEISQIFDSIGYTSEAWKQGVREIPRIYITCIPSLWKAESNDLPLARKKEVFFRLLTPIILRSNELILMEKNELTTLVAALPHPKKTENPRLLALALKYKVIKKEDTLVTPAQLQELKIRVDIIPPSLALAQGAEESGYGTSRFALLGNALFGQWDFTGNGIKPQQQRAELGNYGLAAFDSPLAAVISYSKNLNTHLAYTQMRTLRAKIRQEGRQPTGLELASTLNKYSERGQDYIVGLQSIIRVNKLAGADEAKLWNKSVIQILPAE